MHPDQSTAGASVRVVPVVVTPPFIGRGLGPTFGRVFPCLLPTQRLEVGLPDGDASGHRGEIADVDVLVQREVAEAQRKHL